MRKQLRLSGSGGHGGNVTLHPIRLFGGDNE